MMSIAFQFTVWFYFYCNLFQCKFSKKLLFNIALLFPISGNPSKRQKTNDNPPVEQSIYGSSASVSSMAGTSVAVNPQDTINTSNPPTASPLGRSNSTGYVSNQGNASTM